MHTKTVSEKALLARINRKLRKDDEAVRRCRDGKWSHTLGRFYRVDLRRNAHLDNHINLEELGRELLVLKPHEKLAD